MPVLLRLPVLYGEGIGRAKGGRPPRVPCVLRTRVGLKVPPPTSVPTARTQEVSGHKEVEVFILERNGSFPRVVTAIKGAAFIKVGKIKVPHLKGRGKDSPVLLLTGPEDIRPPSGEVLFPCGLEGTRRGEGVQVETRRTFFAVRCAICSSSIGVPVPVLGQKGKGHEEGQALPAPFTTVCP